MRVDLAALLDTLARWVRLFVVMLGAGADVVALWIVHTHALDAADFTPYLRIKSPEKRCGKTLLEELLELVVARPWRCDRTTPAALLRRVERDRPTLLLDEVDAAMRSGEEYAEALRGLLDSGYRRGNTYTMCVPAPGNGWEVRDWPTWCPKAIAGIGELPGTVADRSIPILLRRKSRHERVQRFRRRKVEPEAAALREQCEAWALQAVERVREAEPHLPEALNDRQQDVCEPLLAIADLAGGEWPERARRALVELCTGAAAADDSFGVRLLGDIRAVFAERQADRREGDRIASRDLAGALGQMEDRPWPEWRAGKPITAPQVARLLGRFGIVPRTIRLADGTTPKGYLASDFEDAWERYLPPEGGAEETTPPSPSDSNRHNATTRINTAENANFQTATGPPCGGSKSATFTTKNAACGGVAFTKREYRQGAYQQSLFEDDRDPSRATPHLPRRQGIGPAQELEHFDL